MAGQDQGDCLLWLVDSMNAQGKIDKLDDQLPSL